MMKPDTCGVCELRGRCKSSIRMASRKAEVAVATCTYLSRSVHRRDPQDIKLRMRYAREVSRKPRARTYRSGVSYSRPENRGKHCMQVHVQHGGSAEWSVHRRNPQDIKSRMSYAREVSRKPRARTYRSGVSYSRPENIGGSTACRCTCERWQRRMKRSPTQPPRYQIEDKLR